MSEELFKAFPDVKKFKNITKMWNGDVTPELQPTQRFLGAALPAATDSRQEN